MKATHIITFWKDAGMQHRQKANGKTDLFNILREMMKDGFTNFVIKTL